MKREDKAGELCAVRGPVKTPQEWVDQRAFKSRTVQCPRRVGLTVVLEVLTLTSINLPLLAFRANAFGGRCWRKAQKVPAAFPSQAELCKNNTAGPGQPPNPDAQ